jgi:hypothetical protein
VRVLLRCSASASCVAPASPIWFTVNNVISKSKHHNTLNYTKAIQMKKMKSEINADITTQHEFIFVRARTPLASCESTAKAMRINSLKGLIEKD